MQKFRLNRDKLKKISSFVYNYQDPQDPEIKKMIVSYYKALGRNHQNHIF